MGKLGSGIDMVGCHQGKIINCTFRYREDIQANGVQTKGDAATSSFSVLGSSTREVAR